MRSIPGGRQPPVADLHQVESETGPAGALGVKIAYRRIEAHLSSAAAHRA